jgi:hypothetical protein
MLRFHGRLSLAAAIVCAGLANAGSPVPAKKAADDDKFMTINDDSGKAHRCQILSTYKHPSGAMARDVKDLQTGEIMTVIDDPAIAKAAAAVAKPAQPDPILQPKQYVDNKKVTEQLGTTSEMKSAAEPKYTKAPTPAGQRWLAKKPAEAKPATIPAVAVAAAQPIEAVRHPDPIFRLIGCLRDDMLPSMREIAAETLARSEGRNRPEVVAALQEAAENDPAPSVRACCSRWLGELRNR